MSTTRTFKLTYEPNLPREDDSDLPVATVTFEAWRLRAGLSRQLPRAPCDDARDRLLKVQVLFCPRYELAQPTVVARQADTDPHASVVGRDC